MWLKCMFSSRKSGFYSLAVCSALALIPFAGQARDNVNCVYKGGSRQVSIDYSGSGCRTLYNPGTGQYRQIAWAKSNLALCKQVANGVISRSGRAAWSCNPDISDSSGHDQPRHIRPSKKAGHENSGDYAILKSSER